MNNTPTEMFPCTNCGGMIWRVGITYQCPDCGAISLSGSFGICYPNFGDDGEECGPDPLFKKIVEAIKKRSQNNPK